MFVLSQRCDTVSICVSLGKALHSKHASLGSGVNEYLVERQYVG